VLKTSLLHPEILSALGRAGHGARVLIADGNYPLSTEAPPTAARVFLNLRRGLVTVSAVLEVLVESIPIEAVTLMEPPAGFPTEVQDDYRKILPASTPMTFRKRHDFYAEVKLPATTLAIATGEARRFANILLTIGVVNGDHA